jgi:hypothetical protein
VPLFGLAVIPLQRGDDPTPRIGLVEGTVARAASVTRAPPCMAASSIFRTVLIKQQLRLPLFTRIAILGVHGVTIAAVSAMSERGQPLDRLPGAVFRDTEVVETLQVEPELRARTEEVAQTQRRIARDGALAIENRRHAVRGNFELTRELRGAHVERLQLLGELITWMNRETCHQSLRQW